MVDHNDGNWHGWNGGDCPVHPESLVEYIWYGRAGLKLEEGQAKRICWNGKPDRGYFIPAFRVIKEYREPREFWIDVHGYAYDDLKLARSASPFAPLIHVREVKDD